MAKIRVEIEEEVKDKVCIGCRFCLTIMLPVQSVCFSISLYTILENAATQENVARNVYKRR